MTYKILISIDEDRNRISVNQLGSTISQHVWDYSKTQTNRVNRRNAGPALVKQLEHERQWALDKVSKQWSDVNSVLGDHKPKYLDNYVHAWSDIDFRDFADKCKSSLEDSHPNAKVTAQDINNLMTSLLTKLLSRDYLDTMASNLKFWLEHSNDWLLDHASDINAAIANYHDDYDTDTTTAYPANSKGYTGLRSFAKDVQSQLSINRQRKLQRYRVRTVVEQAVSNKSKVSNHTYHSSKQLEDDGPEL